MNNNEVDDPESEMTYLEDVDFASGAIDVELAVGRIIGIDALAGEEIDDVLLAILIAVGSSHLFIEKDR